MVNLREARRIAAIAKIKATLKKLNSENLSYDENKFVVEIMREYGTTRRTSLEYIQVAELMLEQDEVEIKKEMEQVLNEAITEKTE